MSAVRAFLLAALVGGCSRQQATIRADVDAQPSEVAVVDACARVLGTWRMREVETEHGVTPESLRVMRVGAGEIVQRSGAEATVEDRDAFRVLERGADTCRIRTQAGQVLSLRLVAPSTLEVTAVPRQGAPLSRWVRVTEPLPSLP